MQAAQPAKLLRIHISESDRHQGQPLYEAIVNKCRELKMAGATVFRGLEGFGETAQIHRKRLGSHEEPVLIAVIDSAGKIDALIPALEPMLETGLMAVSSVRVIRLEKKE